MICTRCGTEAPASRLDDALCAACCLAEMRGMLAVSTRVDVGNVTHITRTPAGQALAPQQPPRARPLGRVLRKIDSQP